MANYTTNTSDKSKGKALKLLLCGGIGLHLFYVGRIGAGIIRMVFGIGMWAVMIGSTVNPEEWGTSGVPMVLIGVIALLLFNVADIFKLLLGKFRDNTGNYLRA